MSISERDIDDLQEAFNTVTRLVNEATLAAMLPTFTPAPGSPQAMLANAQAQAQTLANQTAVGNDYQRAGFHGQGKKGPSDFYPGTPNTPSALTGTTNSFYGSPLKSKEKF
jgi:hypothetical protein